MQIIKALFGECGLFKDNSVIGLSGLRKRHEYAKITIPENYKRTYIPNTKYNFVLI